MEVGASLFLSLTQTYKHTCTLRHTHSCAPPTVIHPPAHPVAVSGVSQEHPLSVRLWLPASVLVIVILPDLLARSWRQESPCLPSTSASQLPPTPQIIQTSCCKVPCLLPPTIFTLASSVVLGCMLFLAASQSLHGVSLLYHTNLITGTVPVLQQVDAESRFNVAMWK